MPSAPHDLLPIVWEECEAVFQGWLAGREVIPRHLADGREGSIWTLDEGGAPRYAIKRWGSSPRCSAAVQHRLGRVLAPRLPVALPAGWGYDAGGHQVLATEFAGRRLLRPDFTVLREVGRILAAVHAVSPDELPLADPGAGFLEDVHARYCSGIDVFPDLALLARWAEAALPAPELSLSHGDFHLGNLVARDRSPVVLDWSDAHLGDSRLDLAWANLLTLIYHGVPAAEAFVSGYAEAARGRFDAVGQEPYDVLAGVRWLLLARTAPVPIVPEWNQAAHDFVRLRLPRGLHWTPN